MRPKNSSYLLLAIILIFFSAFGVWYLFRSSPMRLASSDVTPSPVQEAPGVPTIPSTEDNSDLTASTPVVDGSPAPTPEFQNFTSSYDKFSIVYTSDRNLYEDKENGGNRYIFYRKSGNITVHVGKSWSWVHPGREFTSDFLISGQPTFRYDINRQTIVDIQYDDLNYTIQCIHAAVASNKAECEQFLANFRFSTK